MRDDPQERVEQFLADRDGFRNGKFGFRQAVQAKSDREKHGHPYDTELVSENTD